MCFLRVFCNFAALRNLTLVIVKTRTTDSGINQKSTEAEGIAGFLRPRVGQPIRLSIFLSVLAISYESSAISYLSCSDVCGRGDRLVSLVATWLGISVGRLCLVVLGLLVLACK